MTNVKLQAIGDDSNLLEDVKSKEGLINVLNTENPLNGRVISSSAGGISLIADSSPPTNDPDGRSGLCFHKTVAGTAKFNYYFYGEGNNVKTMDDITNFSAIVSIDKWDNGASIPFLILYSKPTGVGDGGAWFHSSIAYVMELTEDIQIGEMVEIYAKSKPVYKGYRQIPLKTEVITGDGENTEDVLTLSIHSDSGSSINTKILVKNVCYEIKKHNIKRNIELIL